MLFPSRTVSALVKLNLLFGVFALLAPAVARAASCDIYCEYCRCNTATGVCECTNCKIVCAPEE